MKKKLNLPVSVFRVMPKDFKPQVEVASCHIEVDGKFLFAKRSPHKPFGDTWGLPGGKLEEGETPRQASIREIHEEVGITLDDQNLLDVTPLYIRRPNIDFVYYLFHYKFDEIPNVTLNDEHCDYCWVTLKDALNLDLIEAGKEVMAHFKALAEKPKIPRKEFYFIRHGETDVNKDAHIKRTDYDLPLNTRGVEQAKNARNITKKLPLKTFCYSPVQRAVETKEILIEGLEANQMEMQALGECKAAVWSKMVKLEEAMGYEVCDNVDAFLTRVSKGLHDTLHIDEPALIVAHGGIHWALCYFLKVENHPWKIGNCELVHFRPIGDEEWVASIL